MYYHSKVARFHFDHALDARSPDLAIHEITCGCGTSLISDFSGPQDVSAAKRTLARHLRSCTVLPASIRSAATEENLAVYDRDRYDESDVATPGELRVAFHKP
jgi:hypothetical protein